jgi:hypothetical protein
VIDDRFPESKIDASPNLNEKQDSDVVEQVHYNYTTMSVHMNPVIHTPQPLTHKQPRDGANVQCPQITVMLSGSQEDHRDARCVHHANQRTNHITHGITLTNNKAIKLPACTKTTIEIPRLRHAIRTHKRLTDHENLIRIRQFRKLLQRTHQSSIIMSPARCINQHNVEAILLRMSHSISSDVSCIFTVSLFEQIDFAALALAEFLEVADVDAQLLDSAGAERVGCGDEDAVVVLEQEEGDFGEVCGFADAVDADDGENIGARGGGVCVLDFAEEVEG